MPVYTFTTLDDPLGTNGTEARGINDAGQVVGAYQDAAGKLHGFLYRAGGFTTIDVPGASSTTVTGVGDRGQIVGWYVNAAGEHGFEVSPAA